MNKVYSGAFLCALFCGALAVAGCFQHSSLAAPEPITTLTTSVSTVAPTDISTGISTVVLDEPTAVVTRGPTLAVSTPTPQRLSETPTAVTTPAARTVLSPPATTPTPAILEAPAESAPAPAPVGTVVFYEASVTLPTYPFADYQSAALDPTYNWPYQRFDVERFRLEAPTPTPHTYRLLILENAYLKLTILPELGGRIWQVIHKPSGAPMFYQNTVVKPTHWGMENQKGWLALGGLEWGLPVVEHGYDWGVPWGYIPLAYSEDLAAVTVFTPRDGRFLNASITISLRAGAASFEIEPTLTNLTAEALSFSFWHDAMLAPGSGTHPSAQLQFVLPGDKVTLHSTNDAALPLPGQQFTWPVYAQRDFSRLGNFRQYLGFFEAPAAHGPFVGVYDPTYDFGAVRIFPAATMQGSKVFSLGWQDALPSENFTDDDSMYVELHGGLAPTFADQYQLPANGQVNWREVWYPVAGIGELTFANESAALAVQPLAQQLAIGLYATRPLDGRLVRLVDGVAQASLPLHARPDAPFRGTLAMGQTQNVATTLQLQDSAGRPLLTYQLPQD